MSAQGRRLRLSFPPVNARYLRLSLKPGHPQEHWSIHQLELEETPPGNT